MFFFPLGVLDEILNLIESVSEGFPSYFYIYMKISIKLIYLLNLYMIPTNPAQVYLYDNLKSWLCFDDLGLFFKVKVLHVGYFLNQWMDILKTYIDVPLGQA